MTNPNRKQTIIIIIALVIVLAVFLHARNNQAKIANGQTTRWWQVQSVDTMKYSRDLAREKANDPEFENEIDMQMQKIADVGATHVAIATPYDDEFIPYLTKWVDSARGHGLKVWFRGNFSGWEGWFDYKEISPEVHLAKLKNFIIQNEDLFRNGDIFTSCPECENGAMGDPRQTGNIEEYRNFLISEYKTADEAFFAIGVDAMANYFSMNGDVAELVMDKSTTTALGGIVVVDHYVASVDKLVADVDRYAELSGGKVVLGEVGVSIPDIHGTMTNKERALWLKSALGKLAVDDNLVGINYWVLSGSTTALLSDNGTSTELVGILTSFYKPTVVVKRVVDGFGVPVPNASLNIAGRHFIQDSKDNLYIPLVPGVSSATISAEGYKDYDVDLNTIGSQNSLSISSKDDYVVFRILTSVRNFVHSIFAK